MQFIESQVFGFVSLAAFITGVVLSLQKDAPDKSRKSTRDAGLVLIIVSLISFAYRFTVIKSLDNSRGLFGGARCRSDPTDENCTLKSSDLTAFERLLATIGFEKFVQSRARARFLKNEY
jgi:hypothetical protein